MNKRLKSIIFCILVLCMSLASFGCGNEFKSYRPITDVNNLDGRKIGVGLALASDYILSPRDGVDLQLYRYDTTADMLLALYYQQIDAISCDVISWSMMQNVTEGLKKTDESIAMDGFIAYVNPEKPELRNKLNAFLKDYRETPEYAKILGGIAGEVDPGEFGRNSDKNGQGEKVKIAYVGEYYPACYLDVDGTALGFDIEVLYEFAGSYGYNVEFIPTAYQDMCNGTLIGKYDIGIGWISLAYSAEAEAMGVLPTEPFYDIPIYLVEVEDPDKFVIGSELMDF